MSAALNDCFLITGASGLIGRGLTRRLLSMDSTRRIIALDVEQPATPIADDPRYVFHTCDVTQGIEQWARAAAGGCWFHLAYVLDTRRDPDDVLRVATEGTQAFLNAADALGAEKAVLFSSAMVYGAYFDLPAPLSEEAGLLPPEGASYAIGKLRVEELAAAASCAGEVVVLRPCTVLDASQRPRPAADFVGGFPLVDEYDPRVQLLHEQDLMDAIVRVARPGVCGTFNITPDDAGIARSELYRLLGLPDEHVSYRALRADAEAAWHARSPSAPHPANVDYHVAYEWIASNAKARAVLDWTPRWSSLEALWAFIAGERKRMRQKRAG